MSDLTRKRQEGVVAEGSVGFERRLNVTVLDIEGGKMKLGFGVDKQFPSIAERYGNESRPREFSTSCRGTTCCDYRGNRLLFIVLFLLGWKVFGFPTQG